MTNKGANYCDIDWNNLNSCDIEVQKIAISMFYIGYFKKPSLQLQKLYIEENFNRNNNFKITKTDEYFFVMRLWIIISK